jgi:hypothetical protein
MLSPYFRLMPPTKCIVENSIIPGFRQLPQSGWCDKLTGLAQPLFDKSYAYVMRRCFFPTNTFQNLWI